MYRGRFLPGAALFDDEVPVSGPPAQRHPLALLAILAAHPAPHLSRDRACALLWPERDERAARHLLSEALYALRNLLGRDAIRTSGDALALDVGQVWTDVSALRLAVAGGDPETAVQLYGGPFLDGFFLPGSQEFDAWQRDRRGYFASLFEESLYALADTAEAAGDHRSAVHWLRTRLDQDPLSSHATHRLMLALARIGDRAAAILVAREHARVLDVELEIEPAPCVRELESLLASSTPVDLNQIPQCGAPGSGCPPEQPSYPG